MSRRTTKPAGIVARDRYRFAALALLFLVAGLVPGFSAAHQQKTAVTRILFNENTGNIEVMHRYFIHDAEHAAGIVFGASQNLMESSLSRELFSNYVINRFAVTVEDSKGGTVELALDFVGEEIDGQFLWVYQEAPLQQDLVALSVVNVALRDVWPEQANLVNIEKDGQIHSLTFADSIESLRVQL